MINLYIVVGSFLAWSLSTPTWAFTFSPMSVSLDPKGPGATRSFILENDSERDLAIELSISSREINPDGKELQEKSEKISNLFSLYPSQVIVKPKEKRTVRLSWKGPEHLETEQAYRMIVEQLPVDLKKEEKKEGAYIHMLLKYVAAIYVTPSKAKPNIVLKSAEAMSNNKKNFLKLVFENQGTAHKVLEGLKLSVSSASTHQNIELTSQNSVAIKELSKQNILAKTVRQIEIPWPDQLPFGSVTVKFDLKGD